MELDTNSLLKLARKVDYSDLAQAISYGVYDDKGYDALDCIMDRILKGKWDSVNHSAMVKYKLYKILQPYVALLNAEIDSLILACPNCGCSSRCVCGEWTLEDLKSFSEKVLVNLKTGEAYISE